MICVLVPDEGRLISKVDISQLGEGNRNLRRFFTSLNGCRRFSVSKIWRVSFVWVDILPVFIKGSIECYICHLPPPVIVSYPMIEFVICSFFLIVLSSYERSTICILGSFVSLHAKLAALPLAWFWYVINSRNNSE